MLGTQEEMFRLPLKLLASQQTHMNFHHFSSDLSVSYSHVRFQSVIQCLSLRFESAMCMGKLMRKQVGEDKNAHPRIKIS